MDTQRLTIDDIARMAGVSRSTVSRALNNEEDISEKTREKVLKVIKEVNYRPNVHARRTVMNTCNCLGLYIGARVWIRYANAQVLSGIITKCNEAAYDLLLCGLRSAAKIVEMYSERRVDGFVVLNPYPHDAEMLTCLEERHVPYVCTAVCDRPGRFEYVDTDNENAAFAAVSYLIECGHRRIALLRGDDLSSSIQLRVVGYERGLREHGLEVRAEEELKVRTTNVTYDFTGLKAALEGPDPVTACFATTDEIAIQTVYWLKGQGYRVPEDVSVIGFDDLQDVLSGYPMTTIRQDFFGRGYYACEQLIEKIQGDQPLEERIQRLLPYELILRQTVKRRNESV